MPFIPPCPAGQLLHAPATRALRATLVAATMLACAVPAMAQDAASRDREDDRSILVLGERSLTVPDTQQARDAINRTPGGVAIVGDEEFKDTPVKHIQDLLGYVPGVLTQPRMGDDARVSIRGSGLSRSYGARGLAILMDGVPMNTSNESAAFSELDPSAYRYVEVFKGANALRYGANALGGAINFVTPTGHDARLFDGRVDGGSFGYIKGQASTGDSSGRLDWFATASATSNDGYRDHSNGNALRGNANIGYRITPDAETRLYFTGTSTNQHIPGEVSKEQALNAPRSANAGSVELDQQRNVDFFRVANKTTLRFGPTQLTVGGFYNTQHVDHPIYQYLDISVDDYGGFVRAVDERQVGGLRNRLILGANLLNGTVATDQFINIGGEKGDPASSTLDKSSNFAAYAQDSLYLTPDFAVIGGLQYLHAKRDRQDRFLSDGDQSGEKTFNYWSPKIGLLWDVDADWQVFANISRSVEVPSYDVTSFTPGSTQVDAQRATSYEIGTRGQRGAVGWDLSLYRTDLQGELQCVTTAPWALCSQINADRTVHQGLEAGLDADVLQSAFADGDAFSVNAAYTYSDFSFDDDALYGDNRLPGVPMHLLRAEMLYRHPVGIYGGPNVEWSPKSYFADNANTLTVPSYALLNFKLSYDIGQGLSAYVEGRNLADERYISTVAIAGEASADSEVFNPGTGRAVYGGVRFRW